MRAGGTDIWLTPAQCLARYPECAGDLVPLLETANVLLRSNWPQMSAAGRARARSAMHAALERRQERTLSSWLRPVWGQAAMAAMLVIVALGVWLAWPGRKQTRVEVPTATRELPAQNTPAPLPISPTPSSTAEATALSGLRSPTPTAPAALPPTGPAGPTATLTGTPVEAKQAAWAPQQ